MNLKWMSANPIKAKGVVKKSIEHLHWFRSYDQISIIDTKV